MKTVFTLVILLTPFLFNCSSKSSQNVLPNSYLGQIPPGLNPELFAPELVSTNVNEYSPTFSTDGNEVYFTRNVPQCAILYSRNTPEGWTTPEVVAFSGVYDDADPFLSYDNKLLFFGSNRPINNEQKKDFDIWVSEKRDNQWSDPIHLESAINSDHWQVFSSYSRNSDLYFGSNRDEGGFGYEDIYVSNHANGEFSEPRNLGSMINTASYELEACISPDEGYLIFVSGGRTDSIGDMDLYISFRSENGLWSEAINMGEGVNTEFPEQAPIISHDGKYLFFTSKRDSRPSKDIYWVSTAIISELESKAHK